MIHVDRSRISPPSVLSDFGGSLASIERKAATAFFANQKNAQMRFEFKVFRHREVRDALFMLFHGKCAYCESMLRGTSSGDVDHYRPKTPIVESKNHPGYWWLASRWENLFLACNDCNRPRLHGSSVHGKGNRFPLMNENRRAYFEGQEIDEDPLILNPCFDAPEKTLIFDVDGSVASKHRRGQATIELLGLNRPGLVAARRAAANTLRFLIDAAKHEITKKGSYLKVNEVNLRVILEKIREHTLDSSEFAAMNRQIVGAFVKTTDIAQFLEKKWAVPPSPISRKVITDAKQSFQTYHEGRARYSLENKKGREVYRSQRRLIQHIAISNVKSIRHIELAVGDAMENETSWLMLLGENGTGKSTVLQSVAIATMGPHYFAELISSSKTAPSDFLRYRCKNAKIQVKMSGFDRPHQVIFSGGEVKFISPSGSTSVVVVTKNGPSVIGEAWDAQVMLLGYGATRLLPRKENSVRQKGYLRVGNLFNPFVPLADANTVLLKASLANFNAMALVLKDLLALPNDAVFSRVNKKVMVRLHGVNVSLRHLSDGYQSVIALAMDILEVGQRLWNTLSSAEGIVLLDEIGTHLHPTWKMRIVSSLRRALPGIQFISTTHEPLCLRGLGKKEVAVLKRDLDQQIVAIDELPSPADFRIDQLLTSEFFGLNTTFDEDVERDFDQYYALLAKKEKTLDENVLLVELTGKLKDRRYFGSTLREQLMYHAIDQLIVDGTIRQQLPREKLNRAAVKQISELWKGRMATETGEEE